MSTGRRVVITGLGVAAPIGLGVEPFWDALIERRCGLGRVAAFDPSGLPAQIAGELPPFNLADYIPKQYRKSAKVMARDILIAMVCAHDAAVDARLATPCIIARGEAPEPPNVDATRFGANIGAGLICADLTELAGALATATGEDGRFSLRRWGREGMENLTPLWLLKFLPNMLACHVTIVHDCQAPSNTITCQEASSHLAVGEAFRTIARGDADVCICGGAESKVNPMAMARPLLLGRLNTESNASPQTACRPFGRNRRGTVAAEGGGLVILETLDHARRRGARIYAEVVGFGAASNASHWARPDPKGRAIALAVKNALRDAGVGSDNVQLVTPLGVGTIEHDAAEMSGWREVFESNVEPVRALATRGAVGNCGAGSGAIDIVATTMALHRNTVPPSLNTDQLDPACPFRFVQGDPVDVPITHAVTAAQALAGGQVGALVLRRFEE